MSKKILFAMVGLTLCHTEIMAADCTLPPIKPLGIETWSANQTTASLWRSLHQDELKTFSTQQTGHADALPFNNNSLEEMSSWQSALDWLLGPLPNSCEPLQLKISATDLHLTPAEMAQANISPLQENGVTIGYHMRPANYFNIADTRAPWVRIYRLTYNDPVGQRIPAYLLTPQKISKKAIPAVLVAHQALAVCGKKEPLGVCLWSKGANRVLALALEYARRGFVVIAPDLPGYGELQDKNWNSLEYNTRNYRKVLARFPTSSELGTEVAYLKRAVDALFAQDIVRIKPRVGAVGHSKGATLIPLLQIYDGRVKASLANAPGLHLFRTDDVSLYDSVVYNNQPQFPEGAIARWCGWGYLPRMCFFDGNLAALPIDFHHIQALALKKGPYFTVQIEDDGFPGYWPSIDFINTQSDAMATRLQSEYDFRVVASGLRGEDRWVDAEGMTGDQCLVNANGDLKKIWRCQTVLQHFYGHGVYPKTILPLLNRMEEIMLGP
ncbi:exported hypothetical protein [Gammaproteobacteria bacterium]